MTLIDTCYDLLVYSRAPAVKWAQRAEVILLTVELEDIRDPKIDIKDKNISFRYCTFYSF